VAQACARILAGFHHMPELLAALVFAHEDAMTERRPMPREHDAMIAQITDFLEYPNPEFAEATELLGEARDRMRLMAAKIVTMEHTIETEAATYMTVSKLLTEWPTARAWFQAMVIDTIKPGDAWAYQNRTHFEFMLELAEKNNPTPAPEHADKPAKWGQF
jgi:hypothetical protein